MKRRSIQNLITKVKSISMAVVPLSLLLFSGGLKAQTKVTNTFGLDADVWTDTFVVSTGITAAKQGSNDWFKKPYYVGGDHGVFVIDTAGAYGIKQDHVGGNYYPFTKGMAYPPYHVHDTLKFIWAAYLRDQVGTDSTIFTGGDKNGDNPETTWGVASGTVPDKNDLVDGGVFVMRAGLDTTSHLFLYGFSGIYAYNGDRNIDYELFRNDAYVSGANFYNTGDDDGHSAWRFDADGKVIRYGDILVSVEGSGTSVNLISLRIWMKKSTYDSMIAGTLNTPPNGFTLTSNFELSTGGVYGYAEVNYTAPSGGAQFFFGRTNSTLGSPTMSPPWGTFGKSGGTSGYLPNTYYQGQFLEFGIDLTYMGVDPYQFKTLDTGDWCDPSFGSIMIKSRSASSFNSALKDFIGPASFTLPDISVVAANNGKMDCLKSTTKAWVTDTTGNNLNNWYEWVNTSNTNDVVNYGKTFTTNVADTFRVYAMRGEGCRRVDSATIVILKDVVKPVSYPWVTDTIIQGSVWTWDMTGDSSQYYTNLALAPTSSIFGPSGGLSYLWNGISPWNDTITTTVTNPGFLDTGWFELIVTEPRNGCKDTDEVKVFFLPVVWGDFSCAATGNNDVVLNWTTLMEDGAGVFEVQRFNANRFETIGAVSATGHSVMPTHYQFVDMNPNPGRNFYRIKMIGENGSVDFSDYCETVIGAGRGETVTTVGIFPNPAGAEVTISVTGVPAEGAVLSLMDQSGRLVASQTMSSNIAALDISALSSGIYLIKVEGAGFSEVQKLIKK